MEVKKPGEPYNDAEFQIRDIKNYYGISEKSDLMKAVLMNYPLCSAEDYDEVRYLIVIGHLGEIDMNSDKNKKTDDFETVVFK